MHALKKSVFGLGILSLLLFQDKMIAQEIFDVRHPVVLPAIVCEGNPVNAYRVVPAPPEVTSLLKSGRKRTNFEVTYTGFSKEAEAAFQYAVDIWSVLISSPVTIRIEAKWETLQSGVLGSCSPSAYYYNLEGSREMKMYYPVTLAEKIAGHDLNGTNEPDIIASFNSHNVPWSYKTDGDPVTNKYDLATVVLHEIGHGLGFIGSMYVDGGGLGSYGLDDNGYPMIFDKYVGKSTGTMFLNQAIYPPYSTTLGSALKSDKVYFFSDLVYKNNFSQNAKLYAPFTWNSGSSIYHLDDGRFDQTNNALMTHAVDYAEVVHNPGPVTMAVFHEMGWLNTWIKHDTLPDIESVTAPVEILAGITSDTTLKQNTILLHYSTDSFRTEVTVPMSASGKDNEYAGSIPLSVPEVAVFYYISVQDTFGRMYTSPSGVPDTYHSFYFGKDTIKPVIEHQAIPYILEGTDSIEIAALVNDNLGLSTVNVEYFINEGLPDTVHLVNDTLNSFIGRILFPDGTIGLGDSVSYRIIATDASTERNVSFSPASGYHVFKVEAIPAPLYEYYNNFNTADNDFILDGFTRTQPEWFYSPALHSGHPYASPKVDGKEFNFIAQLRYPIILKDSGAALTFYEIALVEPGETGAAYGSDSFYDYVVVEGSVDWGNNWKEFSDGWDCRAYPDWLSKWNSNTDGQGNSLAAGSNGLYRKRVLNMVDSSVFFPGDTVIIRFRLFSDPYANGWGWAIENLGIQGIYVGVENTIFTPENLAAYPNPVSDELTVKLSGVKTEGKIYLQLSNLLGQACYQTVISPEEAQDGHVIPVNALSEGLYLLNVQSDNIHLVRRILIKR